MTLYPQLKTHFFFFLSTITTRITANNIRRIAPNRVPTAIPAIPPGLSPLDTPLPCTAQSEIGFVAVFARVCMCVCVQGGEGGMRVSVGGGKQDRMLQYRNYQRLHCIPFTTKIL